MYAIVQHMSYIKTRCKPKGQGSGIRTKRTIVQVGVGGGNIIRVWSPMSTLTMALLSIILTLAIHNIDTSSHGDRGYSCCGEQHVDDHRVVDHTAHHIGLSDDLKYKYQLEVCSI